MFKILMQQAYCKGESSMNGNSWKMFKILMQQAYCKGESSLFQLLMLSGWEILFKGELTEVEIQILITPENYGTK